MKIGVLGALCACIGVVSTSHAVTIDFEPLASPTTTFVDVRPVYTESGFTISNLSNTTSLTSLWSAGSGNTLFYPGSAALFSNTIDGITELRKTDGNTFDLFSIDLSEIDTGRLGPTNVTFTGNIFGGVTVTQSINLDGIFGFETLLFPGFTNLTSVTWLQTHEFHHFDNINIVPIPATAWLFGSGLVGMICIARRKNMA